MAQAPAKTPSSEAERGRFGLRGIVQEMRDERLNRLNPQPTPVAKAPAAKAKSPASRQPTRPPNAAALQRSAATTSNRPPVTRNTTGNQASTTSKPPIDRTGSYPRNQSALRNAEYSGPVDQNQIAGTTKIAPASASAVVSNRIPYAGPGVRIRLPVGLNIQVNYLIDNADRRVIRPGEEHQLNRKSIHEVRFSRGITEDGRSYGEARYSVREGSYRFALTREGWDLQREADNSETSVPPNFLSRKDSTPLQEPDQASRSYSSISDSPTQPASGEIEETLPAPAPVVRALD